MVVPVADAVGRALKDIRLIKFVGFDARKPDRRQLSLLAKLTNLLDLITRPWRGAHERAHAQVITQQNNVVLKKDEDGSMKSEKIERPAPNAELSRIANLSIEEVESEVAAES